MAAPKNNLEELRKTHSASGVPAQPSRPPATAPGGSTNAPDGKSKYFRFIPPAKTEAVTTAVAANGPKAFQTRPVSIAVAGPSKPPSSVAASRPVSVKQEYVDVELNQPSSTRPLKRLSSEFSAPLVDDAPKKRIKQEAPDNSFDNEAAMYDVQAPRAAPQNPIPVARTASMEASTRANSIQQADEEDLRSKSTVELKMLYDQHRNARLAVMDQLIAILEGQQYGDQTLLRRMKDMYVERENQVQAELDRREGSEPQRTVGSGLGLPPYPPPLPRSRPSSFLGASTPQLPAGRGDLFSPVYEERNEPVAPSFQTPQAKRPNKSFASPHTSSDSAAPSSSTLVPGRLNRSTNSNTSGLDGDEENLWAHFDDDDIEELAMPHISPVRQRPFQSIGNVAVTPRKVRSPSKTSKPSPRQQSPLSVISINSSPGSPKKPPPKPKGKGKEKEVVPAEEEDEDEEDVAEARKRAEDEREIARIQKQKYYPEVMNALRDTFQKDSFRRHQLQAIGATLEGKDVFVLMPTGGGKSLCYQLPAVVRTGETRGVTVVVSPLRSLMSDQVDALKANGVNVLSLSGDMSAEQRREARACLGAKSLDDLPEIIYVTPEKLDKNDGIKDQLQKLYDRNCLARFVVDEAHCLSTWGREFRDSYQSLDKLRKTYPDVPIMALTATANEATVSDVISRLGMRKPVLLKQSFNRTNLYYEVQPKSGKVVEQIFDFIQTRHSGECGVIYCISRNSCERIAKDLRDRFQIPARHYHAGLHERDRETTQRAWQKGVFKVIVATIAFGMGIDKPDVRFVIHHGLPKSLNGYYQETGRAGRDGQPADCLLYYSYSDAMTLMRMIEKPQEGGEKLSKDELKRQKEEIREVVRFCQNDMDCRRQSVLKYFGEKFNPAKCNGGCDNCADETPWRPQDMKEHIKVALHLANSILLSSSERVTLNYVMDVYRGSKKKDIRDRGHVSIQGAGKGQDLPGSLIERLFDSLIAEGALKLELVINKSGYHHTYLAVGPRMKDFLQGKATFVLKVPDKTPPRKSAGQQRVVRKAVYTRTVTEKQVVEEIEGDNGDEDGFQPDDPIDEGDFLPQRAASTRGTKAQARKAARENPYTDDVEDLTEDASTSVDPVQRCMKSLTDLRKTLAAEARVKPTDVFDNETLQLLSVMQPLDMSTLKQSMIDIFGNSDQASAFVTQYGRKILQITLGKTKASTAPSAGPSSKAPQSRSSFDSKKLHAQFDYQAESSSTAVASASAAAGPSRSRFKPVPRRPSGPTTGWIKALPLKKVTK